MKINPAVLFIASGACGVAAMTALYASMIHNPHWLQAVALALLIGAINGGCSYMVFHMVNRRNK